MAKSKKTTPEDKPSWAEIERQLEQRIREREEELRRRREAQEQREAS